jgi:hypothetical protein
MNISITVTDSNGQNPRAIAANTIESVTAVTSDCTHVGVGPATFRANIAASEVIALVAASAPQA